jgi:glycosyltransferase involved in cell wall biosynthesis
MKNVLVVSYYFPPCNGAPSWRPYSWVEHFHKHGIRPFVMTRHWSGQENTWEDFLEPTFLPPQTSTHEHYDVLFLPSKRYKLNDLLSSNRFLRLLFGNIYFFILGCLGRFNTEVDVYLAFKEHLENHLKDNKYEAVIISSPPSNILELISVVKKNSNAVVVADIRDLWNNLMLTVGYKPSIKQRIWDFFYARYYAKWLKDVDLITVIIEQFSVVLKEFSNAPIEVVYNGYESTLFEKMKKNKSDKFVFSVVGNIYPEQDLSILLEGLNLFIARKSTDDFCIRFIGAKSLPLVSDKIIAALPGKFLYISDRVSKEEALQETLDADVLSYCGWKGVKGMISTKAFDYIASGNYVLIAPGDGDVLDRLITDCKCGSSVNSPEEFAQCLDVLYEEWKKNGKLKVESDKEKIEFYSREHQAERMAKLLLELMEKKQRKEY